MLPALLGGLEVTEDAVEAVGDVEDVVEAIDDVEDARWGRIHVYSG